jgi:hypothetical protein
MLVPAALLCLAAAPAAVQWRQRPVITEALVRSHMEMLASDALRGRASASPDELVAATYIAAELRRIGLDPLGDGDGFVQQVDLPAGVRGALPPPDVERAAVRHTWNVLGQLKGRDDTRGAEIILLSAHLDHLGVRGNGADRIYNGADDDASGVTAVLALIEAVKAAGTPRRTVMVALFGSEESGGSGARYFLDHPPAPLTRIVTNLEFEMIGRPDPAIARDALWLTGYERSTLGPALAAQGAKIVADPHPAENFFSRSDNIQLAYRGVIAQTVSSFGLHADYHQPSDDLAHIDFEHLTSAIRSMLPSVRWLADSSFKPEWRAGMQPLPRGR